VLCAALGALPPPPLATISISTKKKGRGRVLFGKGSERKEIAIGPFRRETVPGIGFALALRGLLGYLHRHG
jgi:hypothetical protein